MAFPDTHAVRLALQPLRRRGLREGIDRLLPVDVTRSLAGAPSQCVFATCSAIWNEVNAVDAELEASRRMIFPDYIETQLVDAGRQIDNVQCEASGWQDYRRIGIDGLADLPAVE